MATLKKSRKQTTQYSSDRPIKSIKDDKLGRSEFSKRLARDIRDWHGNDSLTIALYGNWGSGKTSVKNMMLAQLNSGRYRNTNPIIELDAWQFSGSGSLSAVFFRELGIILGKQDETPGIKERSKKLNLYAKLLTLGSKTVKSIGSLVNLSGVHDYGIAERVSDGLDKSAETLEAGNKSFNAQAEDMAESLSEIKAELSDLISAVELPIVTVIDDIDRLSTDEILEVMQLVKANADFPKLVFEPDIYERLPSERRILTRERASQLFGHEIPQEDVDKLVDSLIVFSNSDMKENIKTVLEDLFPAILSRNVRQGGYLPKQNDWLVAARVCHPELFDKYFRLTISNDDISQIEIEKLFAAVGDEAEFKKRIMAFGESEVRQIAIRRLEAFTNQIPIDAMATLTKTLFDLGDEVVNPRGGIFSDRDELTSFWRIIYFRLKNVESEERRFEMVKQGLSKTTGMMLPVQLVSYDERRGDRFDFLLNAERLVELKELCLKRIRVYAKEGKLRNHPRALEVMWRWSEWANTNEVRTWIDSEISTATDAIWFVMLAITEVTVYSSTPQFRYEIKFENFERFVDTARLYSLVCEDQPNMTEKEKVALNEFKRAYESQLDSRC